jgi:aminoglycoside N3'-acetyltransferase
MVCVVPASLVPDPGCRSFRGGAVHLAQVSGAPGGGTSVQGTDLGTDDVWVAASVEQQPKVGVQCMRCAAGCATGIWSGDASDFERLGQDFAAETGQEQHGPVGTTTARLMSQRAVVDHAVAWMEQHRTA